MRQARDVFDGLVSGLDGGGAVSRATARRWIAEALAAGLIVAEGKTSAAKYGLPDSRSGPPPIPDAVEEPDVVPDWDEDELEDRRVVTDRTGRHAMPWTVATDPDPPAPAPDRRDWDRERVAARLSRTVAQRTGRAHRVASQAGP